MEWFKLFSSMKIIWSWYASVLTKILIFTTYMAQKPWTSFLLDLNHFSIVLNSYEDIESTNHFLTQYLLFLKERQILINKICDIDSSLINQNENSLCYTLLFYRDTMHDNIRHIFNSTIKYILSTDRLNIPLFE